MVNKYEISHVWDPEHSTAALIATLTGLEISDVLLKTDKNALTGSQFRKVINSLGYSTNSRFITFFPYTEYPALLRCNKKVKEPDETRGWYAFSYYDNRVYWTNADFSCTLTEFTEDIAPDLNITSMLQVWI